MEAVDGPLRLIVQSELVANEALPAQSKDPRVAAVLESPLQAEEELTTADGGLLIHRTKVSGLRVAAAMEHEVHGPEHTTIESEGYEDWVRTTIACVLKPGEKLRVVKYLTYGWSSRRSLPALRDQVGAALAGARLDGWDGLLREQRDYLDEFWDAADVLVEGDPEVQQAVRFGLFHVLQAGARAEQRPIAAKGLTGPGYDGHAFWDTEMFVLPVLTYTQPSAVRDALRWRHSHAGLGPGAGRDAQPARAPPSPGGPSEGRSAPATGRPARRPSTSPPTSPTRVRRYVHGHRRRRSSSGRSGWSCWSRPPGCGARSATTTGTAGSTSTGSPARTSTPP